MNGTFSKYVLSGIAKLLKLIYDLTRKGRQCMWGKEQQIAVEEIKHRLIKLPVLHLPKNTGRFHLCSDTSKIHYWKCAISDTERKTKINSICE